MIPRVTADQPTEHKAKYYLASIKKKTVQAINSID